jgi:Zn-dependent protease with chaperone function
MSYLSTRFIFSFLQYASRYQTSDPEFIILHTSLLFALSLYANKTFSHHAEYYSDQVGKELAGPLSAQSVFRKANMDTFNKNKNRNDWQKLFAKYGTVLLGDLTRTHPEDAKRLML